MNETTLEGIEAAIAARRAKLPEVSEADLRQRGIILPEGPEAFRQSFGKTFSPAPALWARPRSATELSEVVAFAIQRGLPIKPMGSLCTWSKAACPETTGIALLTDGLVGFSDTEPTLRAELRAPAERPPLAESTEAVRATRRLVRVGAGCTIWAFNEALIERGLALQTMGGYGGERVGGAFSTGTHGSSIYFGPMCDSVRSLDLVWQGVSVRLEPRDGPTDPRLFDRSAEHAGWLLVQHDALFHAARTSYGTMGVAFSYLVEVAPLYHLNEVREPITLAVAREEMRAVVEGTPGNVFDRALSAEYYLNLASQSAAPPVTRVTRTVVPRPARMSKTRSTVDERVFGLLHKLGVDPGRVFTRLFRWMPKRVPGVLDFFIGRLREQFANLYDRVYNMGAANYVGTQVQEIAVPAEHLDAYLDDCLALASRLFTSEQKALTSPIGVRFVKPSPATLAVQGLSYRDAAGNEKPASLWAMINYTLTIGTEHGDELLRAFHDAARPYGGRSHPGKYCFDDHAEWAARHDLPAFLALRRVADPDDVFLNGWNRDLLGIAPAKPKARPAKSERPRSEQPSAFA